MRFYKQKLFLTLSLSIAFAFSVNAQTGEQMATSNHLEQQSFVDYREKRFADFLIKVKQANDLRPNHPRILYNLAIAFALNNEPKTAVQYLQRLADMKLYFQIEKDEDFKTLFEMKSFKTLLKSFAENNKPINKSRKAFTVSDKGLITEGIAYDPKSKRFFVSSIRERKIIAVDKNGKVSDFSSEKDGLWSVSGIAVDSANNLLWAATTAFPQMKDFQKELEGKSGIFKYDLKTGKLLKKFILSDDSEKHAIGDLIVNKNGDVFATDSLAPKIYKLDLEKDQLELFFQTHNFSSLQSLAFSPDEKYLFFADYSRGIFKLKTATKEITQILPNENTTLLGIDGLYFHKGNLIAIQNGVRPHRVIEFKLNKDWTKIESQKILEANHTDFMEPTLGTFVGNNFYYIANSQWNLFDRENNLDEEKLRETVVLRLKF